MRFFAAAAVFASAAMLAGCANKFETITPEIQAGMMADLRAGKLNLDCGLKCKLTWESQAPSVHALDVAERWPDLAVRVMQIGYGSDLAYYYLGQSAQGLKYHDAAIGYYNYSAALSGGGDALLRCEAGANNACQGVDLAASIPVLVQASRDAIAQEQAQQAAVAAPVHHRRHKPAAAPAQKASDWVAPPPAASASQSGGSGGSGWAAPPPPPAQQQ